MASLRPDKARKALRVQYQVALGGKPKHRSKYSKQKDRAAHLYQMAEILERCSKRGAPPTPAQITGILECQLISPEEMRRNFPYWGTGMTMARAAQATDYDALLAAYEEYALRHSKAADPARKTHKTHMNAATNAIKWMREVAPRPARPYPAKSHGLVRLPARVQVTADCQPQHQPAQGTAGPGRRTGHDRQ